MVLSVKDKSRVKTAAHLCSLRMVSMRLSIVWFCVYMFATWSYGLITSRTQTYCLFYSPDVLLSDTIGALEVTNPHEQHTFSDSDSSTHYSTFHHSVSPKVSPPPDVSHLYDAVTAPMGDADMAYMVPDVEMEW